METGVQIGPPEKIPRGNQSKTRWKHAVAPRRPKSSGNNIAGISSPRHRRGFNPKCRELPFGRMIVAAIQVGRLSAPDSWRSGAGWHGAASSKRPARPRLGKGLLDCHHGMTGWTSAQSALHPAHRRALLRAMQESRTRAARNVIHDYRHLLESETAMGRRATLPGHEP